MSLVINTNPTSLGAQRNLAGTQRSLAGNVGRLSSGLRINQASDDAAGLGISERLKAQVRGLAQAARNANDGVSMIQVADGAMNEQAGILVRLRELAVQSANGTLGSQERGYINSEANQLISEIDRISAVTEFNGVRMLASGSTAISMQVGITGNTESQISVGFASTTSTALGLGSMSLSGVSGSQTALTTLDSAINTLSSRRATVGAAQNRLGTTITNLAVAEENLSAANSRIRDVDVAKETASLTRNQILSQAGIAMLSQANQLPAAALSLIG